jgi:chromate reductase, NAD(P)H dehydrogenase (quinone)
MHKKNLFAICGSTKSTSTNLSLLKAIAGLMVEEWNVIIYTDIDKIPHFNPDLDNEFPPQAVAGFRHLLKAADGILICTPEYAMGVPGSLKNAIDWTVSSCEFSHKPTALITASSQGQKGHASLLETLSIIEAGISNETQLLISFIKTKVKNDTIVDAATLQQVKDVMQALVNKCRIEN